MTHRVIHVLKRHLCRACRAALENPELPPAQYRPCESCQERERVRRFVEAAQHRNPYEVLFKTERGP